MSHQLAEALQELKFTSYEASIYLALISHNPATGYELSKTSQVPQAKVYETLPRLVEKGAVISLGGDPARYVPVAPQQLIQKLRQTFQNAVDTLEEGINQLGGYRIPACAVNFVGKGIMEQARQMLGRAQLEVLLLASAPVAELFSQEIKAARAHEILVRVQEAIPLGMLGQESLHRSLLSLELDLRQVFLLLVDNRELLVGEPPLAAMAAAMWMDNAAVVNLIRGLLGDWPASQPAASVSTSSGANEQFRQESHWDFFAPPLLEQGRIN